MITTAFTKLVGASAPIQLAAMPGIATPELVAAVADAGGLGMFGDADAAAAPLLEAGSSSSRAHARRVRRQLPDARFSTAACLEVAARRARVVEFFYGEPRRRARRARARGRRARRAGRSARSRRRWPPSARAATSSSCRAPRRAATCAARRASCRCSPQVLDAVRVPVVAAGGIATARRPRGGARCGAAARAHRHALRRRRGVGRAPAYVKALLAAQRGGHVPHRGVLGGLARMRRTACCARAIAAAERARGRGRRRGARRRAALPMPRFSVMPPTRTTTGHVEAMALYAGESVAQRRLGASPRPRSSRELVAGAERLLREAGR